MTPFNDIDFGHSYLRFSSDGANHTPRIRLDAVCTLVTANDTRSYYLGCACLAENMYRPTGLIQQPVAEFTIILSPGREFQILKRHASAEFDVRRSLRVGERMPTHDGRGSTMLSVDAHLKHAPRITPVRDYETFRRALLDDHTLNARTTYLDHDRQTQIILDYPATTTNVANDQRAWQVDAGPILMPVDAAPGALEVDRMELAYIVFNQFDYAEVATNQRAAVGSGHTRHFAQPRGFACKNELYALV